MPHTFDQTELMERVDHDLEFLRETVQMLCDDGRSLMAQVRRAATAGDALALGRAAHTLKGMVSNFCAADTQARAQAVESLGKRGDLSAAPLAVAELEANLEALIAELSSFLAEKTQCES